MAYTKTVWKDRVVEKPRNYTITNNADGTITLTPAPGVITEAGTPIIAANLNNMENCLAELDSSKASKITDFLNSLANAGYQKLPSGLIIQWGTASGITAGAGKSITFPIAFPNACRSITVTEGSGGVNYCTYKIDVLTNIGFTVWGVNSNNNAVYWMAIGY